jgi:RNA polymerase sigma-70 factor, ECF subfamily
MSVAEKLEPHRPALTGHCYRMLGSGVEADDAVQETMLRAWKGYDGFDARSGLKTWLYRIATNVCIDQLRSRARRELPTKAGPVGTVDDELVSKPRTHWLEPVSDVHALPVEASPEKQAELRQSLRLAFVAALQHLPARQRAALLLKDVLGFSTAEIAETLETSSTSVNSALQRARKTLADRQLGHLDRELPTPPRELSPTQTELVERYVDAFHRYDVDALVALLREDGTLSMPPFTLWLQGRAPVRDWLLGRGIGCRGSRLVPTAACGSIAFGQYRRGESGHQAWSLIVLELAGDQIASMIHFLDVQTVFPLFGLPLKL